MAYGIIGYSQPSAANQPSGSVFGDEANPELIDEGTGYFVCLDFKATLPTAATANAFAIDSGTLAYNTSFDSVLTLTTGGTQNDDAAILTRPLAPITPGSGVKIAMEANIGLQDVTTAKSVFVGLATLPSLTSKTLLTASSGTKDSNAIGGTAGGSFVGFYLHGDALTDFDIVWANTVTTALYPNYGAGTAAAPTAGSINNPTTSAVASGTVLQGVLANSQTSLTPNPGNLGYSTGAPNTPAFPAALVVDTTAPTVALQGTTNYQQSMVNGTQHFIKLGIRYDGQQYLYFYVNGFQVAKMAVTTAFDITHSFAAITAVSAGTGAAAVLDVSWLQAAAKVR